MIMTDDDLDIQVYNLKSLFAINQQSLHNIQKISTEVGDIFYVDNLYKDVETKFKENIKNEYDLRNLTNSVLTYSDLQTNKNTDYKFDLDKFTSTVNCINCIVIILAINYYCLTKTFKN